MNQESFETGGVIVEGKLKVEGRRVFEQAMGRFPDGAHVTVRVNVTKRKRSLQQNKYWHGVVVPIFAEYCGYDFEEAKDALSLTLLPMEVPDLRTGEIKTVPGHTSELTVTAFNELIERAQRLGAELGLYIPDPNEVSGWS